MDKEIFTKNLFISIYLTLNNFGYSEISLKNEDLKEYIPKLENILKELINTDIFIQTPVLETYDAYKDFLIDIIYKNNLGNFNNEYNKLTLDVPLFYIYKYQKEMIKYIDLILKCCYAITNNVVFVEDDTIAEIISTSNHSKLTKKQ